MAHRYRVHLVLEHKSDKEDWHDHLSMAKESSDPSVPLLEIRKAIDHVLKNHIQTLPLNDEKDKDHDRH